MHDGHPVPATTDTELAYAPGIVDAEGRVPESRELAAAAGEDVARAILASEDLPIAVRDAAFDRAARLVCRTLGAPMAIVSVVGANWQVVAGGHGLDDALETRRVTPLTHSLCQYVVKLDQPVVLPDTSASAELADNLARQDLGIRAYLGVPLRDFDGRPVGSVSACEVRPRAWTEADLAALQDVADSCTAEIAVRAESQYARRLVHHSTMLSDTAEALATALSAEEIAGHVTDAVTNGFGARSRLLHVVDAGPRTTLVDAATTERVAGPWPTSWDQAVTESASQALDASGRAVTDGAVRHLVLPLRTSGSVRGLLELTWDDAYPIGPAERLTLDALARAVAGALERAAFLEPRTRMVRTLQEAMLTELPQPDHLEIQARYVPATLGHSVGGDWYDALVRPDGSVVLAVGDVTGHDEVAAATMGQLRGLLRAFAFDRDEDPDAVLARLDRANAGLDLDALATAVVARLRPVGLPGVAGHWDVTGSNAGHPPPLMRHADGTVDVLSEPADLLLGMDADTRRTAGGVRLLEGDTLFLYTDGLVEARERGARVGITELADALARSDQGSLREMLDAVIGFMRTSGSVVDDVCLLAVRLHDTLATKATSLGAA